MGWRASIGEYSGVSPRVVGAYQQQRAICINMEMMVGKAGRWRRSSRSSPPPQSRPIGGIYGQGFQHSDARADHRITARKQCLIESFRPERPSRFPAVRLRGLPFDCCESDVLKFFLGLGVVDVLLMHSRGRRLSGEAYVVFSTPMQVVWALQKHGQTIRHRYIEVFNCGRGDYYRAIAAESRRQPETDHPEHTGVLRLRGLPFSATKKDIILFFDRFKIRDGDVHLILSANGRTTGEAFVTFASCLESKAAMCKDKMTLGERYIELFPTSRAEAETTYFTT